MMPRKKDEVRIFRSHGNCDCCGIECGIEFAVTDDMMKYSIIPMDDIINEKIHPQPYLCPECSVQRDAYMKVREDYYRGQHDA